MYPQIDILTNGVELLDSCLKLNHNNEVINFYGWEFTLPYKGCSLLWYVWPDNVAKPIFTSNAKYHPIKLLGKNELQQHRSVSYGSAYTYSGVEHPVEKVTPPEIEKLMDITSNLYNKSSDLTVMCLANNYNTGYQSVGSHADNMKQWGEIKDVVCWVTGATRRLILRDKKTKQVILSVHLPEGVYIMKGNQFQEKIKHEIPKEKVSLFEKLRVIVPERLLLPPLDDNKKFSLRTPHKLEQSDWLAEHPKQVKKAFPEKYNDYKEWKRSRQSYTIRFFEKDV